MYFENLYMLISRVKPDFIRVDADEVTYPLHVIMRFEIEKAIFNDEIKTKEIPEYLQQKMEHYLGITPATDKDGCMQDIYWPSGSVGYFSTYTNGAIIASMLMKAAKQKYPNINTELSTGNFTSLNNYLNKSLRNHRSNMQSDQLLKESTGFSQIMPELFFEYLEDKYLG